MQFVAHQCVTLEEAPDVGGQSGAIAEDGGATSAGAAGVRETGIAPNSNNNSKQYLRNKGGPHPNHKQRTKTTAIRISRAARMICSKQQQEQHSGAAR